MAVHIDGGEPVYQFRLASARNGSSVPVGRVGAERRAVSALLAADPMALHGSPSTIIMQTLSGIACGFCDRPIPPGLQRCPVCHGDEGGNAP